MYKKQKMLKVATKHFAAKGFEKTTTSQIAKSAGVTEPLLFYHFKSKNGIFEEIIKNISKDYFSRLENLDRCANSQIEKIENFFWMHFDFIKEMPEECYIFATICPSQLKNTDHICIQNAVRLTQRLTSFLTGCIDEGIRNNEFHHHIRTKSTAKIIVKLLYGIMISSYPYKSDYLHDTVTSSIEFCKRSLLKQHSN
jgi:AcrR family transcriptional regulator